MAMTDYLETAILNHILRNIALTSPTDVYVALWVGDPTDTGTGGNEVSGGSYVRQSAAFDAPSPAGQTQNTSLITFPVATANWGSITHAAIMDAGGGGNMLYHMALTATKIIDTDDQAKIVVGALQIDQT